MGTFLAGLSKSLGGGLASGLLSQIGPSPERQNRRATHANLQNIVSGAQKAGFNPLTVLRATGGNATGGIPVTSPLSIGAVASQMVGDFIQNYDPIENETKKAEARYYDAQANRIARQAEMQGVQNNTPVTAKNEEPHYDEKIGPLPPPNMRNNKMQVWFGGETYEIDRRTAERLRLKDGDLLMGEDIEALLGGLIGEGTNVANARKQLQDLLGTDLVNNIDFLGAIRRAKEKKGTATPIITKRDLTPSGGSRGRRN